VIGKPTRPRWKEFLFGSLANSLIRESGDIDVFVLHGEAGEERAKPRTPPVEPAIRPDYLRAVATVAVCTGVAWLMRRHFASANLIMV